MTKSTNGGNKKERNERLKLWQIKLIYCHASIEIIVTFTTIPAESNHTSLHDVEQLNTIRTLLEFKSMLHIKQNHK